MTLPTWKRRLGRGLTGAAFVLVLWFYYWTVAANNGFDDWKEMDYFRLLVRGWLKGQLHLDIEPRPELLALPDPYDPAQNDAYKLGDASLYRGKYYLYFGAAPAATLMLPYRLITGHEMPMGAAVFVFASLAFLAAGGLFLAIRRRYFPRSGLIMAPLGVLALGFGTHLLALAQRPMIWELPIAGGAAFTLLAVVSCYRAIHGRHPVAWMAAAGLALGLAVGSRPPTLFAAPLLLAPVWFAWREGNPARAWWRKALAAALPVGLCGLALMAHNYARFDSPLEFGQNYQLSGAYEGKQTHFAPLRYLPHNLYVYFFQPVEWTWEFPFAMAEKVEVGMPGDGYMGTEEVCGLAVTFLYFWFALALPLGWRERALSERRRYLVTLGCIAGYAVPVTAVMLSYFSTCPRYQADFAVPVGLLALCGMLSLERWAQEAPVLWWRVPGVAEKDWPRWRAWLVRGVAVLLCVVTVVMGTLLSFDYHARFLRFNEPLAWQEMDRRSHALLARVGAWLGWIEGPRVLKVRFKAEPVGTVQTFWQPDDARVNERILVEHIGERLIRFGYRRDERPVEWGRPLKWELNHTHTVHVQVPSLYPRPRRSADGLMRRYAFRERTAVSVWFSGGLALGMVTAPLPGPTVAGGRLSPEFSGELRSVARRVFREDEIGPPGLADPHAPRGGVLRMRLILPHRIQREGEPLFASGAHYESSILYVREDGEGVKFVAQNYAHNPVESRPVPRRPGGYELELILPACRPESFGERRKGEIIVRVDGEVVLQVVDMWFGFHPGEEQYGMNAFGTNSAADFRGWMRDVRWARQ